MGNHWHSRALLAVLMASILAGGIGAASEPGERPLRVVIHDRAGGLDPLFDAAAVGGSIDSNVFEPLVAVAENGDIVPKIALRWERRTEKSWVFTLRQDVLFHDGKPCTSEDVVASVLAARDNLASALSTLLANVANVVADGPFAVRIDLRKPDAVFLQELSLAYIFQRPSPAKNARLIGTGPYRIDGDVNGDAMHLRAFDGYWGEKPRERDVELIFDRDEDRAVKRLLAGEADLVTNLQPTTARTVENNPLLWIDSSLGSSVFMLMLNAETEPFADPAIREAAECALDRGAIARDAFQNYARPAGQLVTSAVRGYAAKLEPVARDLARARKLLAGAKNKAPRVLIEYKGGDDRLASMVRSQLAEAGFTVELRAAASWVDLWPRLTNGYAQAALYRWTTAPLDAGIAFNQLAHSASSSAPHFGLTSRPLDRLVEESDATVDPARRMVALERVAEHIAGRRVMLPLVWVMTLSGSRRELTWTPRADGELRLTSFVRTKGKPSS
jgi:peptide/nickel transport system substrate-binding protein